MELLIGLVGFLVVTNGAMAYFAYRTTRAFAALHSQAVAWVSPRGDNPSELAEAIDLMVERVMLRLKMAAMGEKSGDAKAGRRAEEGLMRDFVASQSPLAAMALDNLSPKWARYMADNPALMEKGLQMLKNFGGNPAAKENQANGVEPGVQLTY